MSEYRPEANHDESDATTEHLDDMDDGCGCAEVWEHLSERRDAEASD